MNNLNLNYIKKINLDNNTNEEFQNEEKIENKQI